MIKPRKNLERKIELLKNLLRCLLNNGTISISNYREMTLYQYSSNEISAVLKNLKRIGLVTYKGRVWYLDENLIKSLGLLALPDLLNYVLKNR